MNNIISSYKDMWTRAFDYKGRSNVSEYWWPFFINMLVTLCFIYLIPYAAIAILYQVIILIPSISLAIRRMHDSNRSGWNILWLYIPTIILVVYAGAILYYTQSPEIVDTFLKFFMAMVVGYVIFLVYSIYLLTHHTYPKKNHYGEVPHTKTEEESKEEEVLLEAPANASVEGTLTFKTKAFLEKAMRMKKKEEDTKPLHDKESSASNIVDEIVDNVSHEEMIIDKSKSEVTFKEKGKKSNDKEDNIKQTSEPLREETNKEKTIEPVLVQNTVKDVISATEKEKKTVVKKPKKEATKEVVLPMPELKEPISHVDKMTNHEEIVVMAQLKPSKKRPSKHKTEDKSKVNVSDVKEHKKDTVSKTIEKPFEETRVKTLAEKRAELQQTMSLSKTAIMEEIKKTEEEAKKTETAKTVRRPIKRKSIKPVEVPNVNVEPIRTHSLDTIAKFVEQNMNKDPNEAPTVTATIKRKPVKRKKKEETKE